MVNQLPASAPKMVLQKRKLPVSVQFRLKKEKQRKEIHPIQVAIARSNGRKSTEGYPVQIRVTVNGKRDSGFLLRMPAPTGQLCYVVGPQNNCGEVMTVDPKLWVSGESRLIGRTDEVLQFNEELSKIVGRIKSVHASQIERFAIGHGPKPTAETVKLEYLTRQILLTEKGKRIREKASIVTALDAYYDYCTSLAGTEGELSRSTLEARRWAKMEVVRFLNHEQTPDLAAELINQAWAKRFHQWLTQNGRLKPLSATKLIGILRMALGYLVEQEQLEFNPLVGIRLPRGKKKSVVWLSPEQVERLWQIDEAGQVGTAAFWMKVIVLTGMDYADAVRYVFNRKKYEVAGSGGYKIVIERGKNRSECHIPITDKLDELLSGPFPPPHYLDYINYGLKMIAVKIGFEHNLTTKTGRKTAGAQWLLEGYTVHEISRFLGHSSIAMTESHYLKTAAVTADRGMQRVNASKTSARSFARVA